MNRIHMVYGESGAAMLRLALSDLGREDSVVAFPEVLQYAPLFADFDSSLIYDYALRCSDLQVINNPLIEVLLGPIMSFVTTDFSAYDDVILWRGETAGDKLFCYMACALIGQDLSVVDLAPLRGVLPNPHVAALSMGHCSAENLKLLLGRVKPLAEGEKSANAELWLKWSKSVADLRLLSNKGEIVEADRQIFDDVIISASRGEWQPAARVMAQLLCQVDFTVGDGFLHHRIVELARDGKIMVQPSDRFSAEPDRFAKEIVAGGVDVTELRRFCVKS